MKEYLDSWMARKKEYMAQKKAVEDTFSKALEEVPGWEDRIRIIYLSTGYGYADGGEGPTFIPRVRDIDLFDDGRVRFQIKVAEGWGKWIDIGPVPLPWILDPSTIPFDPGYIKGKIQRRQKYLQEAAEEKEKLEGKIRGFENEIRALSDLLSKNAPPSP